MELIKTLEISYKISKRYEKQREDNKPAQQLFKREILHEDTQHYHNNTIKVTTNRYSRESNYYTS